MQEAFPQVEEEAFAVINRYAQLPQGLFLGGFQLAFAQLFRAKLIKLAVYQVHRPLPVLRVGSEVDAEHARIRVRSYIRLYVIYQSVVLAQRQVQAVVHAGSAQDVV